MFSSTGFDRASLKQIAEQAGLTRNAIANYYPSKLELHAAAFASIQEEAVGRILADASAIEGRADDRIVGLFEAATAFNRVDESFVRFMITSTVDATHHPQLRDQSLAQFGAVREFIQDCLETGRNRGEIEPSTDVPATAQVLVDLLWGLALDSGFFSDETRTRRTVAALGHLVRAALAPPTEASGAWEIST